MSVKLIIVTHNDNDYNMKKSENDYILDNDKIKQDNLLVPDNYFENLPSKINERLLRKPKFFDGKYKAIWIPAISISLIGILFIILNPYTHKADTTSLTEDQQIAMLWDQSYVDDAYLAESHELEQLIDESALINHTAYEESALDKLSAGEIEDYLHQEAIDGEFDSFIDE